MAQYGAFQNYGYYQGAIPQPYPDRLTQLQNQYQQAVNVPQIPAQPVNQGLLWVQGEGGAKSYLVAPNTTVLLMDSDAQKFYLKSADNAGMPNLRIFEYTEVTNKPQEPLQAPYGNNKEMDKYVTREEYEALKRQYDSIMDRLDSISNNAEVEQTAKLSRQKSRGGETNE